MFDIPVLKFVLYVQAATWAEIVDQVMALLVSTKKVLPEYADPIQTALMAPTVHQVSKNVNQSL